MQVANPSTLLDESDFHIVAVRPPAETEPLAIIGPRRVAPGTERTWRIVDATGVVVASGLPGRSLAVRMLGSFATDHSLPLQVQDAQGRATGDRLG